METSKDSVSKCRIALIGAGGVATHFGRAFRSKGYPVVQVWSRTPESAAQLASLLDTDSTTDLDNVTAAADLYLVAIKDSALADVLPRLVKRNPGALYVHTAGSVPMSIWEGLAARHGVLYPLQTLSKGRPLDPKEVPCFVEANNASDLTLLMRLCEELTGESHWASSDMRRALHISAVFACNFTNHLYAVCQHLLEKHGGIPFETLLPLIDETARKVHYLPPSEAQTGPARRDDTNVMNLHLDMLSDEPRLAEIYKLLSDNIKHYDRL